MTASAASRTLEVTILSAEGLTVDCNLITKNVFVQVRAETLSCSTISPGKADGARGNPSWNETLMVQVLLHARSITFDVKRKTSMGTKSVGIAKIALSDFLSEIVSDSCLKFLIPRNWDDLMNGIINFSVRVKSAMASKHEPSGFGAGGIGGEKLLRISNENAVRGSARSARGCTGIPIW